MTDYKNKIWRDDDISVLTPVASFSFVHDIFKRYSVKHTIAVIAKDIEKNVALCEYINANKYLIDIQVHGWEHMDHSEMSEDDLALSFSKSIVAIGDTFGVVPTVFYPPWNRSNETVVKIAEMFKLTVRPDKISLSQYLRKNGAVREDTINFHYWYEAEANDLYKALKIYSEI